MHPSVAEKQRSAVKIKVEKSMTNNHNKYTRLPRKKNLFLRMSKTGKREVKNFVIFSS
jgi:hypothetical protein